MDAVFATILFVGQLPLAVWGLRVTRSSWRNSLLLSALLVAAVASSLLVPARGNGTSASVAPASISVTVGQQFTVQLWIKGVVGMISFDLQVRWDKNAIGYVTCHFHLTQNGVSGPSHVHGDPAVGTAWFGAGIFSPPYTGDAYWVTLTFKCLATGTTLIQMPNGEWNGEVDFDALEGATVQQNAPQTTTTTRAVGGVIVLSNKYMTLAPYLALIGLVATAAVAAAVSKRRKKRRSKTS